MEADEVTPKNEVIYFSMNMPNWFMEKPLNDKCDIVENLAKELESEKPITQQEWNELIPSE